jgi:trehalose/maltose hydrolase-like predicted phosphorylase
MAGGVDLIQRCFTGLSTTRDVLRFGPHWPGKLGTLRMVLRYRGHRLVAEVSTAGVTLSVDPGPGAAIAVRCFGRTRLLKPGESRTWSVRSG